jgi:hypothetical protein
MHVAKESTNCQKAYLMQTHACNANHYTVRDVCDEYYEHNQYHWPAVYDWREQISDKYGIEKKMMRRSTGIQWVFKI